MRGQTAALVLATALTTIGLATTAAAQTGPPPPKSPTGKPVALVAAGLHTPTSFAFGAGAIFEGDGGAEAKNGPPTGGGVYLLKDGAGTRLEGSPQFVGGLAWHGGKLYVSGGSFTGPKTAKWQLQAWSDWNGSRFMTRKVIYTAPKGFQGFNGIAFGPGGRLYAGTDVGLLNNNDHGPAKTPYVYSILSLKPNGHDLRVFATGIRQPWQMAFAPGSGRPYVSDLGQDKGVKNPPDFVLHVKKGDNYGFPRCTQVVKRRCKGFAKPLQSFGPHTDIMGMVVSGGRLHMTSFMGPGGKGPGGQVVSMPIAGGALTPELTGFVAPVVGLGVNDGKLYVGALTGQVFSVEL